MPRARQIVIGRRRKSGTSLDLLGLGGILMHSLSRLVAAVFLLLSSAIGALAQSNPAVGLWSTTLYSGPGRAYASLIMQLSPNGRFDEQMVVTPGGVANYSGTWQLDPQQMTFTYTVYNFSPPTIPPIAPVGTPVTNRVEFTNGGATMLLDQPGTVPLVWTRQQ